MRLIIKGPLKCSGACAFSWVSSGKSFAFHLDVYGFMHGTTYCLIGHHGNDIVAVGSSRLRVNGWIWAWVCSVSEERPLKMVYKSRSRGSSTGEPKQHICTVVSIKKLLTFLLIGFCPFTEIHIQNSTLRSWGWWEIIVRAPWSTGSPGSNFRPLTPLKTH